ncbi:MAG: hypothetical protein H6Q00_3279 [Holophagaceae bacterium]|nr:hypothetical protein [Holophagaceae bacterium]
MARIRGASPGAHPDRPEGSLERGPGQPVLEGRLDTALAELGQGIGLLADAQDSDHPFATAGGIVRPEGFQMDRRQAGRARGLLDPGGFQGGAVPAVSGLFGHGLGVVGPVLVADEVPQGVDHGPSPPSGLHPGQGLEDVGVVADDEIRPGLHQAAGQLLLAG